MNRISPRDMRIFVAGAMALYGFESLTWVPSYLIYDFLHPGSGNALILPEIISPILTILSLPLGIGILFGNAKAIRWAKIYLAFWLAISFFALLLIFALSIKSHWQSIGDFLPNLIICLVLLWLLCSRRFRESPEGQIPN